MTYNVRSIAKEAGVSVSTVSRVINNVPTVAQELRERVQAVIDKKNYLPNSSARSLSIQKQEIIGVILPSLQGEFFPELIKGLDAVARQHHYHILLSSTHGKPNEADRIVRSLYGKVDGFIIVVPEVIGRLLKIVSQRVPTVWVNQALADGQATTVMTDNFNAACTMTEHLIAQGRRKLAFISGPEHNYEACERRRGFLHTLSQHQIEPILILKGDFTEESGFHAAQSILQGLPDVDAVFAANDLMALGCLFALRNADIGIPEQLLLAGFDDIPVARFVHPQLTTVRVQARHLGERAVELLMKKMNHQNTPIENEVISPQLVVRHSTSVMS